MSRATSARLLRLLASKALQPQQACNIPQLTMMALLQAEASAASVANLGFARSIYTTAPSLSATLASILKEEVDYEKQNYQKPEAIASGPPAPFTLSEAPGDTLLTLSRSFGSEQINVDLHVNNQPSAEDDSESADGEEILNTVVFNVHVTKGENSLVFECESDGTFVAINHVSYEPKDGVMSESSYTGPVFDELDNRLQAEFSGYLQERGISPELGEYLRHLVYDKEVREYSGWLQSVRDFVDKK